MHKITRQIFKGHLTHIMSILSFSHFLLKLQCLCLFFLLFSLLNTDFTIYFYILVLYSVFAKHKLGSSVIEEIKNTVLPTEFLTVSNTLRLNYLDFLIRFV